MKQFSCSVHSLFIYTLKCCIVLFLSCFVLFLLLLLFYSWFVLVLFIFCSVCVCFWFCSERAFNLALIHLSQKIITYEITHKTKQNQAALKTFLQNSLPVWSKHTNVHLFVTFHCWYNEQQHFFFFFCNFHVFFESSIWTIQFIIYKILINSELKWSSFLKSKQCRMSSLKLLRDISFPLKSSMLIFIEWYTAVLYQIQTKIPALFNTQCYFFADIWYSPMFYVIFFNFLNSICLFRMVFHRFRISYFVYKTVEQNDITSIL